MKKILSDIGKAFCYIWQIIYKYRFLWKRIGVGLLTLFCALILCFCLLELMPADSIEQFAIRLAAERRISLEEARALAIQILGYNPDAPIYEKLWSYIVNLAHGNLGVSIVDPSINVNYVIKKTLPWTLFISSVSLFISFELGTVSGAYMAWKRVKRTDNILTTYIVFSSSVPDYILGLFILYIFAYQLGWFPQMGAYDISTEVGFNWPFIASCLYHAALPIITYVFIQTASWALMMKGSSIAVMGEDYILAARARGIPQRVIVKKYLRQNAMLPLITTLALSFAGLFGGSPLMESIFNYPGIGQAYSTYIGQRDYFMIIGILFFSSFVIIFANIIADSLYSLIDPRIRRGEA